MKFKDWLIVAAILFIGYFVLTNHGSSYPEHDSDEYYEKKQEARIEEEIYKQGDWQDGYEKGYAQAEWEYRGALEGAEHEIEYAYEAGFEDGYQACLKEYGLFGN